MPFSDMMRETVILIKTNGEKFEGIKANVQKKKIFTHNSNILIEPGDFIQRNMSNGGVETYKVIDPGFHEAAFRIPAGYQMDVKNINSVEAKETIRSIVNNYHLSDNSRINNNSIDHSTNTIGADHKEFHECIESILKAINDSNVNSQEKESSLELLKEIKGQLEAGTAKKPVLNALIQALPAANNILSLASNLLKFI